MQRVRHLYGSSAVFGGRDKELFRGAFLHRLKKQTSLGLNTELCDSSRDDPRG